ncbi:MAG: alpha/beta hydrolase [Methanoregula sp.]|jgi:pimeloyl-ACP methyl ester carboxylesterase|nr:alpha/beta hydrolase [Methanoregula sp.]
MPTVHVNDIDMYYEIHGEGEPLLMILGMGMNIASFNNPEFIRMFAEQYRVIAFDNRGVGRSSKPDTPFTVETMAQDTIGLMDALGIRRAHVKGGSLGGAVAQILAAEHPERVNGLVLSGAASRYPFLMKTMVCLAPKIPFMRKKSVQMAEPLFREPYPPTETTYLNQCVAGASFDGRKYHGRIRAPTLITNMAHDQYVPMKYTRELVGGIRGSRLELIDRDHLAYLTEPELIARPALDFLNEVDSGTRGP